MTTLLLTLLACGGPTERDRSSSPVPATVDLTVPDAQEPEFTDLEGFFVKGPPGLPASFRDMRFGAGPGLIRLTNKGISDPDRPRMDQEVGGQLVIGGTPLGYEDVRHSFIFVGSELAALDISLPAKAALPVLRDHWGEPSASGVDDQGRPTASWTGPEVDATLLEVQSRAVIKFVPTASGSALQSEQ